MALASLLYKTQTKQACEHQHALRRTGRHSEEAAATERRAFCSLGAMVADCLKEKGATYQREALYGAARGALIAKHR